MTLSVRLLNAAFGLLVWLTLLVPVVSAQDSVVCGIADTPVANTPTGAATVRIGTVTRTPDLLILLAKETLAPEDYAEMRRFIAAVYRASHADTVIRIAEFRQGATLDIAGPFGSASELLSLLRKTVPGDSPASGLEPPSFFPALAASLEPEPSAWHFTLVVGRMPRFGDTAVAHYAAAWMTRRFIAQKRSMLWFDPSGETVPAWLGSVARNTGGAAFGGVDELTRILHDAGNHAERCMSLSWDHMRLTRGFDIEIVHLKGLADTPWDVPIVSSQSGDIPSIAEYSELREKTDQAATMLAGPQPDPEALRARLERALAINPSDREAVKLGIQLAAREKKAPVEIALLETAVELTPGDASTWTRLGDLRYERHDFAAAEAALLKARELGSFVSTSAEELGRIRFGQKDLKGAAAYIEESLRLDAGQQSL